ncbi:hypothetical protein BKA67DRAFT_528633 [Truncatella angustata]|uniref:DUF4396 domain-containing protein n=1 Tax=Truncatella angustata TaxID=152316 RepID=A0A9P8U7S0_9PEZI|nr:uncharacterized protein BKA67DRAFT_528633 [Truncatella angustata]KAH6638661.1 hypothetical protein BKA67DRAFT_528633 [Truncatella angustata]
MQQFLSRLPRPKVTHQHGCHIFLAPRKSVWGVSRYSDHEAPRANASNDRLQSIYKFDKGPEKRGPQPLELRFWRCKHTWRRASVNTFRCLLGCTTGDFAAMWFLQAYFPTLGLGPTMAIAMASGLTTSMVLETVLLRLGRDSLTWPAAAKTAAGMSLISMISMEAAENIVDYHLTGGVVALHDPVFWAAAALSAVAGFLTPLPYNYLRLKKYGKACH